MVGRSFTVSLRGAGNKEWKLENRLFLLPPTRKWTHGDFLVCKLDPMLMHCMHGFFSVDMILNVPSAPERQPMFKAAPALDEDRLLLASLPSDYEDDWPELSDEESE